MKPNTANQMLTRINGQAMPVFCIVVVMMIIGIGFIIDSSNLYVMRQKVQNSVDATLIAVGEEYMALAKSHPKKEDSDYWQARLVSTLNMNIYRNIDGENAELYSTCSNNGGAGFNPLTAQCCTASTTPVTLDVSSGTRYFNVDCKVNAKTLLLNKGLSLFFNSTGQIDYSTRVVEAKGKFSLSGGTQGDVMVVFVVDASRSISNKEMEMAKNGIKSAIDKLTDSDYFAVTSFHMFFNGGCSHGTGCNSSNWKSNMWAPPTRGTVAGKNAAKAQIDAIDWSNKKHYSKEQTFAQGGLFLARQIINSWEDIEPDYAKYRKFIIFLSDGQINHGTFYNVATDPASSNPSEPAYPELVVGAFPPLDMKIYDMTPPTVLNAWNFEQEINAPSTSIHGYAARRPDPINHATNRFTLTTGNARGSCTVAEIEAGTCGTPGRYNDTSPVEPSNPLNLPRAANGSANCPDALDYKRFADPDMPYTPSDAEEAEEVGVFLPGVSDPTTDGKPVPPTCDRWVSNVENCNESNNCQLIRFETWNDWLATADPAFALSFRKRIRLNYESRCASAQRRYGIPLAAREADLARRQGMEVFAVCTSCQPAGAYGNGPTEQLIYVMRRIAGDFYNATEYKGGKFDAKGGDDDAANFDEDEWGQTSTSGNTYLAKIDVPFYYWLNKLYFAGGSTCDWSGDVFETRQCGGGSAGGYPSCKHSEYRPLPTPSNVNCNGYSNNYWDPCWAFDGMLKPDGSVKDYYALAAGGFPAAMSLPETFCNKTRSELKNSNNAIYSVNRRHYYARKEDNKTVADPDIDLDTIIPSIIEDVKEDTGYLIE